MFDFYKREMEWGGKKLSIETGKIARQADGAVVVTYGGTKVLCTVVAKKEPADVDFFPLTINYQEKAYAAGKVPGGYLKREGRPSDNETLICRLIDRPIRPLFTKNFKHETQVVCTVLAHDLENNPDIPALIGASAALTISGLPFLGPLGAARVGYVDGKFVLNPTIADLENSNLDLVVAGTSEGVLMVESEASELSEETMLDAVMFGHESFAPVIDLIIDLAEACAKEPWDLPEPAYDGKKLEAEITKLISKDLEAAYKLQEKQARQKALSTLKEKVAEPFDTSESYPENAIKGMFKIVESKHVRGMVLKTGSRIDGRNTTTVRPIVCEAGILDRAHGSALFTRGETQALVVATLGTSDDEQRVDTLVGEYKARFLLHYNFPAYSVGEVGRMMGVSRREIGHGKLAWRAINPLLPSMEEFPYMLRVVSEITESNGSSSMATVCGTTLALMDAGVPLKRPVAGIAMGLIKEGKDFAVLTDILGDEDHLGDMDFKVAGTKRGITSLQMDLKITSIDKAIMKQALAQAKDGRFHILDIMEKEIEAPRADLHDLAPRMHSIQIDKEKIRDVIGTGGKVIREIVEKTGAKVNIDDSGIVTISSNDGASLKAAIEWVEAIVQEAEIGKIYHGKIARIVDFGAFVTIFNGTDGLLHISQIADERVENVTDYLSEGEMIHVKVLDVDGRGKIKLSMRSIDQKSGLEQAKEA